MTTILTVSDRDGSRKHAQAVALRLVSIVLFSAMAICVRVAVAEAAISQVVFFRAAFALIPLLVYLSLQGNIGVNLRTTHLNRHLTRGLIGGVALFCAFVSYATLPLAIATALTFLTPLFTMAVAPVMLKERIRRAVYIPVLLGFGGVLTVLSSAATGEQADSISAIGVVCGLTAAFLSALSFNLIRQMTQTEPPGRIAVYFSVLLSIAVLPSALLGWPSVSLFTIATMATAGFLGGIGHIAMTEAFARAPVSKLAACDYTALLWAIAADFLIWGLMPPPIAALGSALIVGAAAVPLIAGSSTKKSS
jgi:drug/metabolite transporter (DMT)-like permease